MNLTNELLQEIEKGNIRKAILTNGETVRIFKNESGPVCRFAKNSSKKGYPINVDTIVDVIFEKSADDVEWDNIQKYRKLAEKSSFENSFIVQCKNLPKSKEQWIFEGKKSLYNYGITSGNQLDGKTYSLKTVANKISKYGSFFDTMKKRIENKEVFRMSDFDFDGKDGTVSFEIKPNGEFYGYLSREYRGTGNGFYYIMINENTFIGCDVD